VLPNLDLPGGPDNDPADDAELVCVLDVPSIVFRLSYDPAMPPLYSSTMILVSFVVFGFPCNFCCASIAPACD
jgi:hypothetical protein